MNLEGSVVNSVLNAGEIMDRGCFLWGTSESLGFSPPSTEHSYSPEVVIHRIIVYHTPVLLIVGNVLYLYGLGQNEG